MVGVDALVLFDVGAHRVHEREIVAGRVGRRAVPRWAHVVADVPRRAEAVRAGLAVGKDDAEAFAVGERVVLGDIVHRLAAHRVAVENEHEGDGLRLIERRREVGEVRPSRSADHERAVREALLARANAARWAAAGSARRAGRRCAGRRARDARRRHGRCGRRRRRAGGRGRGRRCATACARRMGIAAASSRGEGEAERRRSDGKASEAHDGIIPPSLPRRAGTHRFLVARGAHAISVGRGKWRQRRRRPARSTRWGCRPPRRDDARWSR